MAGKEEAASDEYNILVGTTSNLGSRIRGSLDFLCKNSTNLPEVIVHLLSHNLLIQRESEIAKNQLSSFDGFYNLFNFLIPRLGHGDNSQHFVNAFLQSGNKHILQELKNAVVTTDFDPSCAETSFPRIQYNVREPVESFEGRENFLRDLHQHILLSQPTPADVPTKSTIISRIRAVTGLGGIGKTETMRKYIHSYGHCYQNVVWIDAEEHTSAENQFKRLALHELKLPPKDIETNAKDFDVILKEIYDHLCTKQTLLVLDNAEAFHDSDPKRPGVARFLPKSLPPTHLKPVVLITSRQLEWPDIHPMPLQLWTQQESRDFIFRQLKLEESDVNKKDAGSLSETFGGLPLALRAAVAVILQQSKRNDLMGKDVYTIQHLLSDYNKEKRKVLNKRPPGSPDCLPLMLLWNVSLDKIRQQPHGHLASHILNVMAHLFSTNIPNDLLFFIFNSEDSDSLVDAVELLVDYSFVHNSKTYFSIHRMLQDVTLTHLEEALIEETPKKRELLLVTPPLTRITTALKKYWPTVPKSSKVYDAVHDNLVHVTMSHVLPKAQNLSEADLYFIEFIEFVFVEIKDTRRVEAEKCCRGLITYFTSFSFPSHSASQFQSPTLKKVWHLQRRLAVMLREMGRLKEANDICQELLSSFNSAEDQEDVMLEILQTKNALASILGRQGDYEEAIKLFSSVVEFLSSLHGPTHPSTLEIKDNLALALEKSGRLSEAKTRFAETLEVSIKEMGPLHLDTIRIKSNMAKILCEEGRYDDALEMISEVVEVRKRELGPLHADTLGSNIYLACVLELQGKYEDALRICANVISIYEKASTDSHSDCLAVKNNMAKILGKQGKVDEAMEMLCHVRDARERLMGPSHAETLIAKHNVAILLKIQGKHAEALTLFEEVLKVRTKKHGPTHPDALTANHSIGEVHLKMRNFEKAESILKEVLAARKATLPTDHPSIKRTQKLYVRAIVRNYFATHEKQSLWSRLLKHFNYYFQ